MQGPPRDRGAELAFFFFFLKAEQRSPVHRALAWPSCLSLLHSRRPSSGGGWLEVAGRRFLPGAPGLA